MVDDHGWEVLKKSGEHVVPNSKADYFIKFGYNSTPLSHANPLPVTSSYEKIIDTILQSNWMKLAVYDKVVLAFAADRLSGTVDFYEDGYVIGSAAIVFTSDISWSYDLYRYLNNDDGVPLDDDSGNFLILE